MSNTLVAPLSHASARYAVASHGQGTVRAYRSAWAAWAAWCPDPLAGTEADICDYLSARAEAGLSASSIYVNLAAIRHGYKLASRPWPGGDRLQMVVGGIVRSVGAAPSRQATAATTPLLLQMLPHIPLARDRAMVLVAFGAALRRSEVVALDLADIEMEARGVRVTIRRSKADQIGAGAVRAIAGALGGLVRTHLREWLALRGDVPGPLFGPLIGGVPQRLHDQVVNRVVATAARDARLPGRWSSHSLRSGLITSASQTGAGLAAIAQHARHKRIDTTLGYIRGETVWSDNPTAGVMDETPGT